MSDTGPDASLLFDLAPASPFSFKCQACGACCHNKAISVDPDGAERLAAQRGLSVEEFRRLFTEADGTLRNGADGSCVFLAAGRCSVYAARPLVCRMFPLGLIRDEHGRERFGVMPLHPDCLGIVDQDTTVAGYLESQGASEFWEH